MSSPFDGTANPIAVAFFSAIRASTLERLSSLPRRIEDRPVPFELTLVESDRPADEDGPEDLDHSSLPPRGPGGRAS